MNLEIEALIASSSALIKSLVSETFRDSHLKTPEFNRGQADQMFWPELSKAAHELLPNYFKVALVKISKILSALDSDRSTS